MHLCQSEAGAVPVCDQSSGVGGASVLCRIAAQCVVATVFWICCVFTSSLLGLRGEFWCASWSCYLSACLSLSVVLLVSPL